MRFYLVVSPPHDTLFVSIGTDNVGVPTNISTSIQRENIDMDGYMAATYVS